MNRFARNRQWPAVAVAVGAVVMALVGTAIAASGPATTSVSVAKVGKQVRKALGKANRAIRIARRTSKQRGPQGPAGAQGAQGATGPQGPPGVSGMVIVEAATAENSEDEKIEEVECPPGKRVFGGGANVEGSVYTSVAIDLNAPNSDTAWIAAAHEHTATGGAWELQVYAICGNAS